MLLGLQGYYTNIGPTVLANKEIIDRCHDLWHIEQTFRIANSDLASRPIFHHKADAVKSHILICFTALMFAKFLEIKTKFSTKQIIDALWAVKQAKLFDRTNGNNVFLQSEADNYSKDIISRVEKVLPY